jgi:transposase
MDIKEVIGIDASKLTLDCYIHGSGLQKNFSNNLKGIGQLADWAISNSCSKKTGLVYIRGHRTLYT